MDKETFLKKLKKNLKYLSGKEKKEQLVYYDNLDDYNLDPIEEANKIYERMGIKAKIMDISLKDGIMNIIEALRSKDKDKIISVVLFFLYLLLLIIVIKIPFIYIRDIPVSIFSDFFKNDNHYYLYVFILDIIYAITTILIFIRLIKDKGYKLKNNNFSNDKKASSK